MLHLAATNYSNSAYLISTAIANASKEKFYTDDLPSLEDVGVIVMQIY